MSWDKTVPSLFGGGHFASHPLDEKRAFEWLASLRERDIGWKEARQQLNSYMASKGWASEDVKKQLEKARLMLKPWLTD